MTVARNTRQAVETLSNVSPYARNTRSAVEALSSSLENVVKTIYPSSNDSAESFGTLSITSSGHIFPTSIDSTEAFGEIAILDTSSVMASAIRGRHYRLMIEGCEVEWVSHVALEKNLSDGRKRYAGLEYEGLKINEELSLVDAMVNMSSMTVTIRDRRAAKQFAVYPVQLASYTAKIVSNDDLITGGINITVDSTANLYEGQVIHIGTAAYYIANISGLVLTVFQCHWDTQRQNHYVAADYGTDGTYFTTSNAIYDRPFSLLKRRAYLFEYDDEDSDNQRLFDTMCERITLDVNPATDWAAGDIITGQSSGAHATVVRKLLDASGDTYTITSRSGTFTFGEVVGVTGTADKLADQGPANPVITGDYGAELMTGDRLIWRGVVASIPSLDSDGLSWKLTLNSVTDLLNQGIGRNDSYSPIGVYRPYCYGCGIQVSGDNWDSQTNDRITKHIDGYFATTQDFIDAINVALDEIVDAQNTVDGYYKLSALVLYEGDAGYELRATVANPSKQAATFSIAFFDNGIGSVTCDHEDIKWEGTSGLEKGVIVKTSEMANAYTYRLLLSKGEAYPVDKTGTLYPSTANNPNNWIDPPPASADTSTNTTMYVLDGPGTICNNPTTTNPICRLYLEPRLINLLKITDAIRIDDGDNYYDINTIKSIDVVNNFITYDVGSSQVFCGPDTKIQIIALPVASSVAAALISTNPNVADKSPETDLGWYPFITHADFDEASLSLCISAQAAKSYNQIYSNRGFSLVEQIATKSWLREELKLIGYFLGFSDTGSMEVFPMESDESGAIALTDDSIALAGGKSIAYARNKYGIINSIEYTDHCDGIDTVYNVLTTNSPYFKAKDLNKYQINPKSSNTVVFNPTTNPSVFTDFESQILEFLNRDYLVMTIPVLGSLRDLLTIGTWLSITSNYILNYETGEYGISSQSAMVIGRSFDLDPKKAAVGAVTVITKHTVNYYWTVEVFVEIACPFGVSVNQDTGEVYITTYYDSEDGCVYSVPSIGGTPTALVSGKKRLKGCTNDGDYVYAIVQALGGGLWPYISKVPVGGGTEDSLSLSYYLNCYFICCDASYLYYDYSWNYGGIMRATKDTGSREPWAATKSVSKGMYCDGTRMLWARNLGAGSSVVLEANMDGSNVETIISDINCPTCVAFDDIFYYTSDPSGTIDTIRAYKRSDHSFYAFVSNKELSNDGSKQMASNGTDKLYIADFTAGKVWVCTRHRT